MTNSHRSDLLNWDRLNSMLSYVAQGIMSEGAFPNIPKRDRIETPLEQGDETTKEYWHKRQLDNPWEEEAGLEKAEKSILDAFPEETKFDYGVVVRRIPNLMELYEKDILNEYTMRKIYPSSMFDGLSYADNMSWLGRRKKYFKLWADGFRKQPPPEELLDLLPFCIIYPPPSGGKAVVTYKVDRMKALNAEFKIFTVTIGGGLSMKLSEEQTFPAKKDRPQLVKMKVKHIITRYYKKEGAQDYYDHKYIADKRGGNFFDQSDLSTSPIISFDTRNMESLGGFGSLDSSIDEPATRTREVEEKTNWKLGLTNISIGGKEPLLVLDLDIEGEKTKLFSIKYDFPMGHKYFLWRKKDENPLVPICTESFDRNEIH